MTAADIDTILPFERDMFGTEAWSRNGYRAELADRRHRYYVVVERDGVEPDGVEPDGVEPDGVEPDGAIGPVVIGWGGVMVIGESAEILTVGVVPSARRRGSARRLVAALLGEAEQRGAVECFLEVRVDNDAARELYRSEGFEPLGVRRGYYDAGRVDALTMRRALTALPDTSVRLPHPSGASSAGKTSHTDGQGAPAAQGAATTTAQGASSATTTTQGASQGAPAAQGAATTGEHQR